MDCFSTGSITSDPFLFSVADTSVLVVFETGSSFLIRASLLFNGATTSFCILSELFSSSEVTEKASLCFSIMHWFV